MNHSEIDIDVPSPFNFSAAAYSHGWVALEPNRWDNETETLSLPFSLADGRVVDLAIKAAGTEEHPHIRLQVTHEHQLAEDSREELVSIVKRMFRIDEDLGDFYRLCEAHGEPWARLLDGGGRLLRSPTLFEDVVKTICTTNIQWSGTKSMVANLVQSLGKPFPGDDRLKAFPTPQAIAGAPAELLVRARLGYRTDYISGFAKQVANGKFDPAALEDPNLSTEELREQLLVIKGVGNYAANTLLMLLGRYSYLAYDTELRDFVGEKYFEGQQPAEAQVQALYESWGDWKYLAYWFDTLEEQ